MGRSRRVTKFCSGVIAAVLLTAPMLRAQQAAPIVLFTEKEQIPLTAYAEMMRAGFLQRTFGSPRDIPTVSEIQYFRCGLTGWAPKGVLVASEEIFKSEFAERR